MVVKQELKGYQYCYLKGLISLKISSFSRLYF